MKHRLTFILIFLMILGLPGCSDTQPPELNQEVEKSAIYEVINVSGMPWVLDSDEVGYFDDLNAIDVSDFTVDSGASLRGGASSGSDNFIETSSSSYEYTLDLAAGAVPEDPEEENQIEDFEVYTLKISGKYNEPVVIEWDGGGFKQVN